MVWHDMACLIVIYDSVGTCNETIIMVGMLDDDDDDGGLSTSFSNLCSCPCPSVPTRIITTLFSLPYTINWEILLIVLYDGIVLVRMNWYTGYSETTIRYNIAISIVCVMYCPMGTVTI